MPPFASCVAADLCGNYKLAAKKILTSRTIRLHRVQKKITYNITCTNQVQMYFFWILLHSRILVRVWRHTVYVESYTRGKYS